MLNAVRRRWEHARHFKIEFKTPQLNETDAPLRPSPIGAFAALLVEWKLTQARERCDAVATRKSA